MNNEEVYVVMAIERRSAEDGQQNSGHSCYCVCDSKQTAEQIIENDTARGDIHNGAFIEPHVIQTKELI